VRPFPISPPAGYSGTPLAAKLGIKEDSRLTLLRAPEGLRLDLPSGVMVRHAARGSSDVVLAFFIRESELDQRLDRLGSMIFPSGSLWIAWPKRAAGLATDLSDLAVRRVVLRTGMVDNKVCAIDETWSALRFVWRREHRPH
jgi:hypothetical protein